MATGPSQAPARNEHARRGPIARPFATEPASSCSIPLQQRAAVLARVPAFATLSAAVRHEAAARMDETSFPAGGAVVTEGEPGDLFYLIVAGWADVRTVGPAGPVPLAALGPGESFGEIALLTPG